MVQVPFQVTCCFDSNQLKARVKELLCPRQMPALSLRLFPLECSSIKVQRSSIVISQLAVGVSSVNLLCLVMKIVS